jgi:crotonobetainyl-CoA:carnitine CoA-transferase CaiB-like acyl-CoA transferase
VAALSALAARERDGKGRLVECAQLEGFLAMVSEGLIEHQLTGQPPARRGNRRSGSTPSGAYHLGDDRWVALEVQSDAQWAALAAAIALPWTADSDLSSLAGREANAAVVAANVAAWVLETGLDGVLDACESAGVPASLVHNEGETLGLEPLLASGFWQGMDREPVGYYLYPTIAYSMDGVRPLPQFPAPVLGQHTEEVLEAMGYDTTARAELAATGVTGRLQAVSA